jgi:3-oxo-5-alpha-steroid 4-dehydrogenase 1
MSEREAFDGLIIGWFALSAVTFGALLTIAAPYGRHARAGWGPSVGPRLGWVLMECPAVFGMILWFYLGDRSLASVSAGFLGLWLWHYVYRTFVFSALIRGGRPMPLVIALMGFVFNLANSYLNGRWLFSLGPVHAPTWLTDPRFFAGAALFFAGFAIHVHSDHVLRSLRRPDDPPGAYRIPEGGLFRWVSAPNYLGELLQWLGWALATWSISGLAFLTWTAANLLPRALANHRWYRERFPEYPRRRRALIPGLL